MTTPRYPQGCVEGSKELRDTSDSDYAFYVNLNNGNVNWNNRNNNGLVVACRRVSPREYQGVSLRDLFEAYKKAKLGKVPSLDQAQFSLRWMDGLLDLQDRLSARTWEPSPSICFIADSPKAREIHAPAFADRVVHHWVVPPLEEKWEPKFIFDSYSNRPTKGTHAAVARLTDFVHQVESGEGGGYFLQLDIWNFFNCINRRILYRLLKAGMERHGISLEVQHVVHALLKRSPLSHGVKYHGSSGNRVEMNNTEALSAVWNRP